MPALRPWIVSALVGGELNQKAYTPSGNLTIGVDGGGGGWWSWKRKHASTYILYFIHICFNPVGNYDMENRDLTWKTN